MQRDQQYNQYVSTHYHHVAPATVDSFRRRYYVWRSYLEKFLPASKDSAILEIGCGVGHNLYALKELGYHHISGTDYSPECVSVVKRQGFSCYLVNQRSEKTFYTKHTRMFDCVVLYDVLEHCPPLEAKELLESIKIMLRPRGSVIISLPNADHPFSNTLLFADMTHKFIYNARSLSQLLRSSGFSSLTFLQMNSWSYFDDNPIKWLIKNTLLRMMGAVGEMFWIVMAGMQGILLSECKPTLAACGQFDSDTSLP